MRRARMSFFRVSFFLPCSNASMQFECAHGGFSVCFFFSVLHSFQFRIARSLSVDRIIRVSYFARDDAGIRSASNSSLFSNKICLSSISRNMTYKLVRCTYEYTSAFAVVCVYINCLAAFRACVRRRSPCQSSIV